MSFADNIYKVFQLKASVILRGNSEHEYSLIRHGLLTSSLVWIGVTENVLFVKFMVHVVCDHQGYMRSPVQLKLRSSDFLYVYPGKSLLGNI